MGFEQAGFEVAWMCEIDPVAQSILRYHYPDVPLFSDVRDVGAHNLAPVDVITFGSPCQSLSIAGKREGFDGISGIFFEAIRVISELRPRFAVWENVAGALSSAGGQDFLAALDALAEIGALDIATRVLDSRFFGVPQQRRRVFAIADLSDRCSAGEVLLDPESVSGNPAAGSQARQGAAAALAASTDSGSVPGFTRGFGFSRDHPELASTLGTGASAVGGHRQDLDTAGANVVTQESFGLGGNLKVAGSLTNRYHKGINTTLDDGAIVVDWRPVLATGKDTTASILASAGHHGRSSPRGDGSDNLIIEPIAFHATQDPISSDRYSPSLPTDKGAIAVAFAENQRGELVESPTLHALSTGGGKPGVGYPAVRQGLRVRRLMPIECERLMGWSDDATRWGIVNGKVKEIKDTHRYRCIGNGVVANVTKYIAERIAQVLEGEARESVA